MTLLQSIILGIIQGLTEFLPISSSGHLVLTSYLFDWNIPAQEEFLFNVLVQMGTLVAVIIYFLKDLIQIAREFLRGIWQRKPFSHPSARLGWYLLLATLPATLIGLGLEGAVSKAFDSPILTAALLLGTALLLVIAENSGKRQRDMDNLHWQDAVLIGFFQALALFPGISRSGATITGGMISDLKRASAARFSFLMSIPVMLGAGLLTFIDLLQVPNFNGMIATILTGFLTAVVVGYLSIHWLLKYLQHRSLYVFAGYCTLLSILIITLWLFR